MGAIAIIYYIETSYINNLNQKEKDKWKEITIQTIDEHLLLKLIGDDYEQTPL